MYRESPLAQGRGLKLFPPGDCAYPGLSPLAQGRGLKHTLPRLAEFSLTSPLAQGRGLKLLCVGYT